MYVITMYYLFDNAHFFLSLCLFSKRKEKKEKEKKKKRKKEMYCTKGDHFLGITKYVNLFL